MEVSHTDFTEVTRVTGKKQVRKMGGRWLGKGEKRVNNCFRVTRQTAAAGRDTIKHKTKPRPENEYTTKDPRASSSSFRDRVVFNIAFSHLLFVKVNSVMVLATSITTTTFMLSVFADTTVTVADVSLQNVTREGRWISYRSVRHTPGRNFYTQQLSTPRRTVGYRRSSGSFNTNGNTTNVGCNVGMLFL